MTIGLNIDGGNPIPIDIALTQPIDIAITQLPQIDIKLEPVDIKLEPIEIKPLDVSLRLKEVPSLRITFPVDYRVTFGLWGIELACIHFCGQSQIITEPYVPNPCECCGAIARG